MNRNTIWFALVLLFAVSCKPQKKQENTQPETKVDSSSIEILSQKISAGDKSPELFVRRAQAYVDNNQFERGIKDMDVALSIDSTNTANYLLLAEYQMLLGRSGKAKESLEKCLEYDEANVDAMLKLAEIHLYVQQFKESMDWALKAQGSTTTNAHVFFIKSLIYKETGDTLRAIDNLFATVERDPSNYKAYMMLGALHSVENDSLAIPFFKTAIELMPNSIEAYYGLAMFYQQNEKANEALKYYDELLTKADPEYIFAIYNIGFIHLNYTKNFDMAIESFSKCIELKSNYFQAYHNRGFAYEQKKNYVLARQDYQKALQILPNYQLSVDALNRLDKL